MTDTVVPIYSLYKLQLRTCAAIADFAFRRTAEYRDANVEAARHAIATNLKQCEVLVATNGAPFWPAALAHDGSSGAEMASQWQRKWLDIAARTQVEMIHLLNQLATDWSALKSELPTSQPRPEKPVGAVLTSMSQLFDFVLRSWSAAFETAAPATNRKATQEFVRYRKH